MNFKFLRSLFFVLAIIILSGGVGYKLGTNEVKVSWQKYSPFVGVTNKLPPGDKPVDFSLFWAVWDELANKYVDKTKLDTQKMVFGAISGMVAAVGDPYTVFLPPQQNKESKEQLNGSFEGIGAQLGVKDSRIVVIAPLPDSPAQRAGLRSGDWIGKVDGSDTSSWTLPEAVAKIRGPKGTTVTLTVLHPGDSEPAEIKIVRDSIILKSVEWKLVSSTASAGLKPAVYLNLSRFGDKTDPQWDILVNQVNAYLATASARTSGVILDVRDNPGGYLVGSVYVAGEFLKQGTLVVKQQESTGDSQSYSVDRPGKLLGVPMVVLVNRGTASASEILAGSLSVAGRAKLVGVQSFGKGSVQQASDLPMGAGLHVTVAKWLLANGVWINGTGLTPDIKIDNDPKDPVTDFQLDKAVQVLNGLR